MVAIDLSRPDRDFRRYGICDTGRSRGSGRCCFRTDARADELLARFFGLERLVPGREGIYLPAVDATLALPPSSAAVASARACPYGVRLLYDVTAAGAQYLGEALGAQALFFAPPWGEVGGRRALGSVFLPDGEFWRALALYVIWFCERSDCLLEEGRVLHGYRAWEAERFTSLSDARQRLRWVVHPH